MVDIGQKCNFAWFWRFLVKIHQATWDHKFCSKHRRNILRTDSESLNPILFISNFFHIFMLFCNQNGIRCMYCPFPISKPLIPFWLQKGMKMQNFASTNWYLESTRQELSKSGLRMSIRSLVMILCLFLSLQKMAKKEGGPKKNVTTSKNWFSK